MAAAGSSGRPPRRSSPISDRGRAVGQAQPLRRAWLSITVRPERRRQRGDQQAVIAAREHAGDGARGVAAEAVGDEPLVGAAAASAIVRCRRRARVGDATQRAGSSRRHSDAASSTRRLAPAVASRHRSRAAACRRRRSAGPRSTTATSHRMPVGRRQQRLGRRSSDARSRPRLTSSSRSPLRRAEEAQHERVGRRAPRRRRRRGAARANTGSSRRSAQQVAMQRQRVGVALALGRDRACSARRSLDRRDRGSCACSSAGREARELRQELARGPGARPAPARGL